MTRNSNPRDETPCLAVYTCRGRERIFAEGGSQAWRLSTAKAGKLPYIVCVQNRGLDWGEPSHDHHTAFLVGKISGIETLKGGRKLVKISEYADINIPDSWDGARYPIAYTTLEYFGIDLNELDFYEVESDPSAAGEPLSEGGDDEDCIQPLNFEQAKRGLAAFLGIEIEQIEITVKA